MNELQEELLKLLKEFIRVCDKHHLRYFMVGGSCLGAARHEGFIPWDDDIDVGMPREDYDKFVKLQSEYEGTPYFIQTWQTDPHYTYNYGKLRDSSTTFIETYFWKHRINHGVWIDIFPIDGISLTDNKPYKKYAHKIKYVWMQSFLSYIPQLIRSVRKETWLTDILLNIAAGLFYPFDIAHYRRKHVEKFLRKVPYDKAVLVANMGGINAKKEAMPKTLFEEFTKLKFEDIEVNVPKDYDKYLTLLYNDWRKWPPKEKQVGHHYVKGYSLTQDFRSYSREHKI